MRILFSGETFPSARSMIAQRLSGDHFDVWRDRQVIPQMTDLDVLVPMMFRIDAAIMDALKPRIIQQVGSGLEGVDLAAARERQIPVAALPAHGANADSVAEHVLMLMLALLRELPLAQSNIRAGVLGAPQGRMLSGRTACLWGLGATALSLARRLRPLGVTVLGITRDPHAAKIEEYGLESVYATSDSAACLARTDFLIPCVRLSDATRGIINPKVFASLPKGAYFVNAARGPLVDYQALYDALASGRLAGAALDVFWTEPIAPTDPILALPNVIATPHIAGVTDRSYAEIVDGFVANIERFRRGEPLLNRSA
ncbi:MAG TPA: 2-hydroxyacid dehydrogenase [Gemmatimonadaceae bacterium]|nr:2-hydroxyacid dehydrogenase [Gemmatimonadaceae bacterium]